ncbi:MFS transporter [uncultured Thermanaerothrix sp.]|uniref:MFS transporter n=1 Tax=uncultured Thermanaerothrix sp. TaxID=1195149 RepID=UPI00262E3E54|nr:MFS transporter [uncultured Thermanaerothrix sp.]
MDTSASPTTTQAALSPHRALRFVLLIGVVSLLADMTYEGARSINGPFLALLGASGAVVGTVSGLGELIGYSLRLVSGFFSARTRRYWLTTFIGYGINLLAVPLLALSGNWPVAAVLMIAERVGKGIRVPPRDTMLSFATQQVGRGWGFGLHEALDQIGAILGPLVVAAILAIQGNYRHGYAVLLLPALLALGVLAAARYLYPRPQDLEADTPALRFSGFNRAFWIYVLAAGLIAAGFADFPLIAYHFEKAAVVSPAMVPVLYAVAMGVDALAALILGRVFDRLGMVTMMGVAFLTAFFAPLVFLGGAVAAGIGMALWGIGMGAQESIMRAALAERIRPERRALAYGIFNTAYGLFWFGGSVLMGYLYDVALPALIIFSVLVQLAALPLFYVIRGKE